MGQYEDETSEIELPETIDDQYVEQAFQRILNEEEGSYSFALWGLCGQDVSGIDMSNLSLENFRRLTFDSETKFSQEQQEKFHPEELLVRGREFTAGMTRLHETGIDGTGVNIGIIDSPFNSAIPEFDGTDGKPRVKEVFGELSDDTFHGKTTASLAAGRKCGVAPNAALYLYSTNFSKERLDEILQHIIDSGVVLDILSMSAPIQFSDKTQGLLDVLERRGLEHGKEFVFLYSERFREDFALGRASNNGEITLDEWFKAKCAQLDKDVSGNIILPCSGRTSVQLEGKGYKYNGSICGASFAIPQAAGLFAIARQIDPPLQYDEFVEIARSTARRNNMRVDPEGIIEEINRRIALEKDKSLAPKTPAGTVNPFTTREIGEATIDVPTELKMKVAGVEQSEIIREASKNEGGEYNGE